MVTELEAESGVNYIDDLESQSSQWNVRPFQIVSLYDMLKLNADVYFALSSVIQEAMSVANIFKAGGRPLVDDQTKSLMAQDIKRAAELCAQLGLEVSARHAQGFVGRCGEPLTSDFAARDLHTIQMSIIYELQTKLFFHVPSDHAQHYLKPRDKWEEIIDRFPDTISDIEEAQRCFALGRYTAAVFHSVQITEVGLIELGKFIGVNDPLSGWTAVAQKLKQMIDTKYQQKTDFEKQNVSFIEQVQGTVEALKNAWRNKISHAHGKLTLMTGAEFHPDVAEEILVATRAFMRRLVEGLPKEEKAEDV